MIEGGEVKWYSYLGESKGQEGMYRASSHAASFTRVTLLPPSAVVNIKSETLLIPAYY